jgi:hypothetical protein
MNSNEQIIEKFQHIYEVVSSKSFQKMDALGGEIPFWIASYEISKNSLVEIEIKNLTKRLLNEDVNSLVVNLFDLSCDIINKNIGLEKMFEVEVKKDKEKFKKALQSTLNIHDRLIPEIINRLNTENPKILFISGVGAVFPFIRSHTILNNLQSAVKNIPTLMFFPGVYSGRALRLFGTIEDDNYYRAFNIDTYKL